LLLPLMGAALLGGCGPDPRTVAERQRLAEQQRWIKHCQQLRPRLSQLLQAFEAAERDLAAVRAAPYTPTPGPKPLDPNEQRRLTLEDQQTEQDLHDQAVEAWRLVEDQHRERWERSQAARQQQAVEEHDQAAAGLRRLHPDLLLAGALPRLNDPVVQRFRACSAERFR
jgi:hypothetical protein